MSAIPHNESLWKPITAAYKWVLAFALVAAVIADVCAAQFAPEMGRTRLFLWISYTTAVPALTVYLWRKLRTYKFPKRGLGKKLLATSLGITLMPCVALCPWLLAALGPTTSSWRARSAWDLMDGSIPGLALMGGTLVYAAAIVLWMMVFGLIGMWKANDA